MRVGVMFMVVFVGFVITCLLIALAVWTSSDHEPAKKVDPYRDHEEIE